MCRMMLLHKIKPDDGREKERAALADSFIALCETGCVALGTPKGHKDGWGMASFTDEAPMAVYHSMVPPINDPEKNILARALQSKRTVVSHIRKASKGGPALENCHPFARDGFVFAHNGKVGSIDDIIKENIDRDLTHHLDYVGDTDSERLFAFILDRANRAVPTDSENRTSEYRKKRAEAFTEALTFLTGKVVEKFKTDPEPNTSFCIVATDGENCWAMRLYNPGHPEVETRGLDPYYTLYAKADSESEVRICSEPVGNASEWTAMPNGDLWQFDGSGQKTTRNFLL